MDDGMISEVTTFTRMPQCPKCLAFDPHYEHVIADELIGGEVVSSMATTQSALKITCSRCSYAWLMQCAAETDLA